jgi:hypothetical protein
VRKAVVGGTAVAVLAVVCLLLLSDGDMPFLPGRPPTTSNPDPVGLPSGGPTVDVDELYVRLSLELEADDLSALVGPKDSTTASDLRGPVDVSVRNPLAYLDDEVDSLDGIAEFDRDGGEVRSELDWLTRDTEGALASVLLALIVLKAQRDQDRDRRVRAAAPASAVTAA